MKYHYDIKYGVRKLKSKSSLLISVLGVAVLGLSAAFNLVPSFVTAAPLDVVYNNIPSPQPGNVPSVGFEATSTSEFGGQLGLDGTARVNPVVTVLMSSWACKSGTWNNKNCITNPGSTFTHPVTLNIYAVNPDNSPGTLLKTVTQTFTMPYRPTADDGTFCNAGNNSEGLWWDGTKCDNGKAFPIVFNLNGVILPDEVIVGVAYNTTHYGYAPIGTTACNSTVQGCPYDSLNVGTAPSPTVGDALPTENDAYQNSSWTGAYCLPDQTTGTFRLDPGCWTGYLPAIKVEASKAKNDHHHHDHHHHHHDYDGDKDDKDHKSKNYNSLWND